LGIIIPYVVPFACSTSFLAIVGIETVNWLFRLHFAVQAAGVATGRTISSPCFALLLSLFLATGGDANLRTSCIRTIGFLWLASAWSAVIIEVGKPVFAVMALTLILSYIK